MKSGKDQDDDNMKKMGVIMYDDFARADLPDKKVEEIQKLIDQEKRKSIQPASPPVNPYDYSDSSRPTGYANEIDEDPSWAPSASKDDFMKVLKDVYIGSDYDSAAKKQARYVVRNITGFSVAIGLIFTIIWYAFPGRFISYKGDKDSLNNPSSSIQYVNPDELLSKDLYNNRDVQFEDTKPPTDVIQWQDGIPSRPDQRIPIDGVKTGFDPTGFWKPPTTQSPKELNF